MSKAGGQLQLITVTAISYNFFTELIDVTLAVLRVILIISIVITHDGYLDGLAAKRSV